MAIFHSYVCLPRMYWVQKDPSARKDLAVFAAQKGWWSVSKLALAEQRLGGLLKFSGLPQGNLKAKFETGESFAAGIVGFFAFPCSPGSVAFQFGAVLNSSG